MAVWLNCSDSVHLLVFWWVFHPWVQNSHVGLPINNALSWGQVKVMNPLQQPEWSQKPQELSVVAAWSGTLFECFQTTNAFLVWKIFTHNPKFVSPFRWGKSSISFYSVCHLGITCAHDLFLYCSAYHLFHYRNAHCSRNSSQALPNIRDIWKRTPTLHLNFTVLKKNRNKIPGWRIGSVTWLGNF